MSKARDIANILSANTAIATDAEVASAVSAAVSTHATAANGHVGRGTTENRPASPTIGDLYFDTTIGAVMVYKALGWEKASADPAPQVSTISPLTAATTGTTITITGSNFKSGLAVQFVGTNLTAYNSPIATFVNGTTATATTPALLAAYEPYDVKVINSDNQFGLLENCLDSGGSPSWNTASGNIASVQELKSLSISVSATDPDGTSIVYSSSDLPAWISLNSSTGALSGTAPSVSSDTTYTFNILASDGVNSSSRSFNIAVINNIVLGISGLHSWYDAADASSITSSAGNVTQWNDISGNSRHAILSGGGSSPTIGVAAQNGKNVINFNGVNQFLVAPASLTSNAMTVFSVYRRNSGTGSGTFGRLFSFWGANPLDYSSTSSWEIHTSAQSFAGITPPLVGFYRDSAQVAGSTIVYGTSYLFSGTLNGGSWSQNNSGTLASGTTSTSSINVSNNTLGAGMASGGGDAYFTGWFAEQIVYNRVLTTQEIADVRGYLSAKWGVS
jgi:hypothetical protein